MDDRTRVIIENLGCEEGQAKLALALSNNNVEQALSDFNSIMNDVEIIKGKIRSDITDVYGLFIIIMDAEKKKIIRLGSVLTKNVGVHDTKLNGSWFVFERKIYTVRLGEGILQNATQDLEQFLFDNLQSEKCKHFFDMLKQGTIKEIKEFLFSLISQIHSLPKLKLDVKFEKLKKAYQKKPANKNNPVAADNSSANLTDTRANIRLQVALVKGDDKSSIPAKYLLKGDMVMAEVIDDRDVAGYISRLLGGMKEEKFVPLFSIVEDIKFQDKVVIAKVRFSPGITGTAYIRPKEKVKIVREAGNLFFRKFKKIFIDISKKITYN
ncbi:hypothetical protein ACFL4O_02370 [bacterium]